MPPTFNNYSINMSDLIKYHLPLDAEVAHLRLNEPEEGSPDVGHGPPPLHLGMAYCASVWTDATIVSY